jgi:Tfp pilus assembly protein PilN
MYTIDLLKGQGIPERSGPERFVVMGLATAGPVIVAIIVLGLYLSNAVAISVQRKGIAGYEAKVARPELAEALVQQKAFEQKKSVINGYLAEISGAIGRHTQWSPVLQTIVELMPDSVILTKLEVKEESIKQKVPSRDDPTKMVEVSVPVRRLLMGLSANTKMGCDRQVRDYRDQLRFSEFLGPRLENIVVDRNEDKLDNREVVSYQIDFEFKPGF